MSRFNLLSEQHKKELTQIVATRVLYAVAASFVIWAAVFGITVFSAQQFLSIQNEAIQERIQDVRSFKGAEEAQQFEEKIVQLNSTLITVRRVRDAQNHDIVSILERITELAPPGVQLQSLTFSESSGSLLINGHAGLREQVIELQDRLEEDAKFADVKAPLSNLVKATDVDFRFDITLAANDE